MGITGAGETARLTVEFTGPSMYTNPPTWESTPEGPNLLVGSGGSDWKPAENWASSIVPSTTPPPHTASQGTNQHYPAPWTPKAPPLYVTGTPRQKKKNGPSERTDQSSRNIQLSDEEIANLSDAEFKTLVIRMLTELAECGRKLDEKMKAMLSEIKENVQGTNQ